MIKYEPKYASLVVKPDWNRAVVHIDETNNITKEVPLSERIHNAAYNAMYTQLKAEISAPLIISVIESINNKQVTVNINLLTGECS